MSEGKIIATWSTRVVARQAEGEDPQNVEVQTPTNESLERVVVEAVENAWPYLTATASAERTDK